MSNVNRCQAPSCDEQRRGERLIECKCRRMVCDFHWGEPAGKCSPCIVAQLAAKNRKAFRPQPKMTGSAQAKAAREAHLKRQLGMEQARAKRWPAKPGEAVA